MNEKANQKTALYALGVVFFMGAMAWASVPLYDLFCRVTGYGGYTNTSEVESEIILDETITIRVKDVGGNETKFKILKARTKMIKVFNAYAKRNGVLTSKLRFLIGGERVNPESTAATLGLENQDEIDVLGELSDDDGEEGGIIFKPTKTVSLDRSPKFQCKGCMKRFIDWPTCNRHIKNSDHLPLRKTNAPTDASYLRDICTIGRLERSTDTKQKLLPDKMVEVRLSWARP